MTKRLVFLVPGFFGFSSVGTVNYFEDVERSLAVALRRRGVDAADLGPIDGMVQFLAAYPTGQRELAAALRDAGCHAMATHVLASIGVRLVYVCEACGCDLDEPSDECPAHGVEIVEVTLLRAAALGGRPNADTLTDEQIAAVEAWLTGQARPTQHERDLAWQCKLARKGYREARRQVAAVWCALARDGLVR